MKDKFATFNVKWIYVDPADVTATPTNNFYIYFSKLWNPIQNTYNSLLFEKTLLLGGLTIVVLLIIFWQRCCYYLWQYEYSNITGLNCR